MDSRWKFLHCGVTELQGRTRRAGAGRGEPGPSGVPATKEKPCGKMGIRDGDRTKSREDREPCAEKSCYS